MTTEVIVKNKGPQDVTVDVVGVSHAPGTPDPVLSIKLVPPGAADEDATFCVYAHQYLVVRERE